MSSQQSEQALLNNKMQFEAVKKEQFLHLELFRRSAKVMTLDGKYRY